MNRTGYIIFSITFISCSASNSNAINFKSIERNIRRIVRNPKGQLFSPTAKVPKAVYKLATDNFHEVEKSKFYRSKQLTAKQLNAYINKYHIKTVINLRGTNPHKAWWQEERKTVKQSGATYHNIALSAKTLPSNKNITKLLDLYQNAPRPIYVHCFGGSDRTGLASALWALDQQKKPKNKALNQLSLKYGHIEKRFPANRFFINIWKNRAWAHNQYNPVNYSKFAK